MNKGLTYTLNMDTRGFQSGVKQATESVPSMSNAMAGGMIKAQLAIAALQASLAAVGSAFGMATSAINASATREQLEAAFVPLLGGADAAQQRIAELSKFAASTPFELNEISKASRVLETLTRGAMAAGDGLRLVGDVASATGTPFEEVATTIGRLYDGLDSGRPVGEALMRLQELGVVSGEVRGRLEDMQKEGLKGNEVWKVAESAMGRFSGSMEVQSKTWNGKISTLSDAWAEVQNQFGKPLLESLKPLLDDAIGLIEGMAAGAKAVGESLSYAVKFLVATAQSGEVWNLMGAGLQIAFGEAVNFLWKVGYATVGTLGTYFSEQIKTALMWFDILTDVSFWSGAALALGSALGAALSKVMESVLWTFSSVVTPIMNTIGMSDQANSMNQGIGYIADGFKRLSNDMWNDTKDAAGELMDQYGDRIANRYTELGTNIGKKFNAGFSEATDVFNLDDQYKQLGNFKLGIDKQLAAQEANKPKSQTTAKLTTPTAQEPESKIGFQWETLLAGSLAKVGGGDYGKVFFKGEQISEKQLSEAKKTNDILNKMANSQSVAVFAR